MVTVKELKQIAKERGIKYYYKMKKDDLRNILRMDSEYLLDEPVPDISSTILAPSPFQPITQIRKEINKKINSFADWIVSYVPEPIKKVVNKKVDELKSTVSNLYQKYGIRNPIEFKLSQSAVKNVTNQFSVKGINGYDAISFMNAAKKSAIKILKENRKSKVNIVLTCEMERTDIKTGETITTTVPFTMKSTVVLESTDLDKLYKTAKLRILENLSSFQQLRSSWRFASVKKMDINTIEYNPLKAKSYIPLDKNSSTKKAIINIKNEDNQCLSEFPVSFNQITQFENNNKDINVNVYGYENSVYPLRVSKNNDRQHLIDLLLISNGETNHYCLIKSLSKLLSSQKSKKKCTIHYCKNCLLGFNSEESLSKHKSYCDTHDSVRIELPPPISTMQFTNHNRSMRVPFVVYADFESFIKPISTCEPNSNKSYTKQYQKHVPSSFCYYIKCFDKSFHQSNPVSFTASNEMDDVAQIFVDRLQEDIIKICNRIKFKKNIVYTHENKKDFDTATECHICGKNLDNDKKLSGGKLSCIPNNEEKYISFSREIKVEEFVKDGKSVEIKRQNRFLDSYRFMPSSLDSLSKNLSKEQCKNIKKLYSGKQLDLLLKKGVYPYNWVDYVDIFNETQLPPKELLFSKLNDEDISDDDYSHAQTVWNEFDCKTFRDYHDLYNVSDVLLLADVFENLKDVCMKNYKLDPAWYYTSPGLAWDAALKKTKVKLELLSDYDMILMIKKGIRGGISLISNRLGTSNNKYMNDAYDKSKESTFIQYLDANNLNGWAMKILEILEVDLNYPEHLHDDHNDYPLAPERVNIDKVEKLVPNLENKKTYVTHYENLKLYERLDLKITKIHRVLSFKQSSWLSEYIELNTNLRTKATNDFEKDFFKLMNNSVFGKTMENIANRVDVRLVTNRNEAVK
ncbi:uncharacterized protein LOC136088013 [Hydra vulgaris]|uniref:Uncharacterized protein LOC136088013 n=1 Tax=Hydra vulgaris TaxID=6087 RepID=A0ABM4D0F3_HYDVU